MSITKKILGAACLASITALSAPAFAADLGGLPPPRYEPAIDQQPALFSWRGFYAGVHGGYGWGDGSSTLGAADAEGALGGAQIGYNALWNYLLVGVEGDFSWADINDNAGFAGGGFAGNSATDVDWISTVRGRIGIVHDRLLVYATAGFAWADVDYRIGFTNGAETGQFRSGGTETGYVVGGGLEYALSPNWTMKAEYQYIDLDDRTLATVGSLGNTFTTDVDTDIHTARLGLNYKF